MPRSPAANATVRRPVDSFQPVVGRASSAVVAAPASNPFDGWIDGVFTANLGRAPTAAERTAMRAQLQALCDQGLHIFEVGARVEAGLRETPEYAARHPMGRWINDASRKLLGQQLSAAEVSKLEALAQAWGAEGKHIFEIGAGLTFCLKLRPEYRAAHPFGPWIDETFGRMLGRAPSFEELEASEKIISSVLSEGRHVFEAGAAVEFVISLGEEYRSGPHGLVGRILSIAQGEVGTLEATNANDGAAAKYPGFFGRGPEEYCVDFVSWVLTRAGAPVNFYNTETLKRAWMNEGRWKGMENPQPGDVVWFDWNGDGVTDHVGFVKGVNPDGSIQTLEGNTSGPGGREGVWERTRPLSVISGFGRPA